MKLILAKTGEVVPGPKLMRLAGFIYIVDRMSGKGSYARPLGRYHYPRFHSYIEETDQSLVINLHLDQKQASYEGSSRHSGEYDGPAVEGELARIRAVALSAGYQEGELTVTSRRPVVADSIQVPVSQAQVSPTRSLAGGDFRRTLRDREVIKKTWWQKLFGS